MAAAAVPDIITTLHPPTTVSLRSPSIYHPSLSDTPPPLPWLIRTWLVTHSTLPMWRDSRNVRICYAPLPPSDGRERTADRVEHEPSSATLSFLQRVKAPPAKVEGINTATRAGDAGSWDWRGKGLLGFVRSHWEVLGWGERQVEGGGVERWVVTWFEKTMFSAEGVDIYCDRREGVSEQTYALIIDALGGLEAKRVVELVEKGMRKLRIGEAV